MELNAPRGAFFLFSRRENVDTGAMLCAMAGMQRHMPCVASGHAKIIPSLQINQVCCSRVFLLLPVFFASVFIFLRIKIVLFFFACCFLLAFGLCLFVRFGPFPAAIMLLCLRLLLASIISWSSPSPLNFSCPFIYIFFTILTCLLVLLFCCCVSCCVVSVVLLELFSCLLWFFRRPKLNIVSVR